MRCSDERTYLFGKTSLRNVHGMHVKPKPPEKYMMFNSIKGTDGCGLIK